MSRTTFLVVLGLCCLAAAHATQLSDSGTKFRKHFLGIDSSPEKVGANVDHVHVDHVHSGSSDEYLALLAHSEEHFKVDQNRPNNSQMYFRPVSCTLQCVMAITVFALVVYTSLSIARNSDELNGAFKQSMVTQTLTVASRTAAFMPMLCMLFVGCRMYVLATTEGLGEPPDWVKGCMRGASGGMILQMLLVMVLPAFVRKQAVEDAEYDMTEGKAAEAGQKATPPESKAVEDEEQNAKDFVTLTGEQNDVHPVLHTHEFEEGKGFLKWIFYAIQGLSMLLIYGGVAGVVVGIATFPAQTTKISAAVQCTIFLSVLYFGVYLLVFVGRVLPESESQHKFLQASLSMSSVARKAPMFAVLFLVSRMRALNLDPPLGMPPFWMQCCFYSITALAYLEVLAAFLVGYTGRQTKGYYGVYIFRCANKLPNQGMHLCALISYLLLVPCVIGVYLMKDQMGQFAPLSTTMSCVLVFEYVFFGVQLGQTVVLFAEDVMNSELNVLRDTFVAASISLGLCPFLCILFVATRMRALQITQQQGAPPGWAQDCMNFAVFATCVQSFCCLVMPIFIGSACKVDEDGNPDYDLTPMIGAYAVTVVKYVALFLLHGSVLTICYAVFAMTPETAHSGGRIFNDTKALVEALATTCVIFFIALLFSSAKVVGMAVKLAIESCDRALLGVDITIKHAALSAFKGYVHINRLVIHQPDEEIHYARNAEGKMVGTPTGKRLEWREDYIIKVRTVVVKINLWRLLKTKGKEFELQNLSIAGIHANIEKPNTHMKEMNTNVEYILNHMDSLGLIPPPEDPKAKAATSKAKETPKPEKTTTETNATPAAPVDVPKIIIGKIHFGDIGAGVSIRQVPVLGQIHFHPKIGEICFPNVQQDIFGGREDLTPGQTIGCIISAACRKIFKSVVVEMPKQIKHAAGDATKAAARRGAQAMGNIGKSIKASFHKERTRSSTQEGQEAEAAAAAEAKPDASATDTTPKSAPEATPKASEATTAAATPPPEQPPIAG